MNHDPRPVPLHSLNAFTMARIARGVEKYIDPLQQAELLAWAPGGPAAKLQHKSPHCVGVSFDISDPRAAKGAKA